MWGGVNGMVPFRDVQLSVIAARSVIVVYVVT